MVEIMTDKATVTIGAPRAGTILRRTQGRRESVNVPPRRVFELGQASARCLHLGTGSGNGHSHNGGAEEGHGPAATAVERHQTRTCRA